MDQEEVCPCCSCWAEGSAQLGTTKPLNPEPQNLNPTQDMGAEGSAQMLQRHEEHFEQADTNKDGVVDLEEYRFRV